MADNHNLMDSFNFQMQSRKYFGMFSLILLLPVGILLTSTFILIPAYAVNPTTICDTSNTICLNYAASSYYVDHGAFITLTDPTKKGIGSITVSSSAPSVPGSVIYVTLIEQPANSGIFKGYEYFNDNTEYPNTNPDNIIQSPRMPIGSLGNGVFISAYYNLPGGYTSSQGGTYLVPQTTVISSIVDTTGRTWPWPSQVTNAPATQPSTLAMRCDPSDDIGDHICKSWKIVNGPDGFQGLRIPWPNPDGTWSTTKFYQYQCNTSLASSGMLVDTTGVDPQCPSPTDGKRDVYVEVDYLMGHTPDINALNSVAHIYLNNGIRLHIQMGEQIPFHRDSLLINPESIGGGSGNTDYDLIRQYYFGTTSDRNNPVDSSFYGYQPNLTAKKQAFHYLLSVHSQDSNHLRTSGASEIPGDDMSVSFGRFTGGIGTLDDMSATFMHEIGHNLGLNHGGDETKNCKPNYISAMNYLYQSNTIISSRPLDYSHGEQATLDENHLDEYAGIGSSSRNNWIIAYGYNPTSSQPYYPGNYIQYGLVGNGIDFDDSMTGLTSPAPDSHDVAAMISNIPRVEGCSSTTPDSSMHDFNDWGMLNFDMKSTSSWVGGNSVRIDVGPAADPHTESQFVHLAPHAHPNWMIDWFRTFGQSHHVKTFTEHYDINTDDIKELRSLQVTSLRVPIDSLPAYAFQEQNDRYVIDNDIIIADKLGRTWDLADATVMLERTKSDVTNMVTDVKAKQSIIQLLDNSINSHISATVGSYVNATSPTSTVVITFDKLSNGAPISKDVIISSKEFSSKGVLLYGNPISEYCSQATGVAVLAPPHSIPLESFNYLTSADPRQVTMCNAVPVKIVFNNPVKSVTLVFSGPSINYTMTSYSDTDNLLNIANVQPSISNSTYEISFIEKTDSIKYVIFGHESAVTAIKEIRFETSNPTP